MGDRMPFMKGMQRRFSAARPLRRRSDVAPFIPILPFLTPSDLGALYSLGPELGHGQSGIIRSCTSRSSGTLFACKSISKLTCDGKDVAREVCIMKHLSNAGELQTSCCTSHSPSSILRLHDVVEDEGFVHLIMELCRGGDLFSRIKKKRCYPEAQAAFLMKSLLETVQFCHSMGVMHRDIKPENILLIEGSDTSSIKLADFGLALEFSPGQKFFDMAGSSYYMAPEVLQGNYSKEIDMWSAGVVLHILLAGVPPFCGATEQGVFCAIRKGDLTFYSSPWDKISALAKDMITGMLHPDAKSRLTPAQALKHPWIVHHTTNAKHIQPNVPSSIWPRSMKPVQQASAQNLSPCRSPSSSYIPCNQTTSGARMMDAAKRELNMMLVDLIAGMNSDTFCLSDIVAQKRSQNGWRCLTLSQDRSEEIVVVVMGQEKYLVSHDRTRKKIGWKLLKDQLISANLYSIH